ncbi:Na+/H+ antiporter subunit E [Chloroflexota bacterium]
MKQSATSSKKPLVSKQSLAFAFLFFTTMLLFWLVLSGRFQAKYIIIGIFTALAITYFSRHLFYSHLYDGQHIHIRTSEVVGEYWRFLFYIPWLVSRIVMANIRVTNIVLNPKLPIDPVLFQFRTLLPRTIAKIILANSITLTPGTITVQLDENLLTIHTLDFSLADDIAIARMQNRICHIFKCTLEQPPDMHKAHTIGELES